MFSGPFQSFSSKEPVNSLLFLAPGLFPVIPLPRPHAHPLSAPRIAIPSWPHCCASLDLSPRLFLIQSFEIQEEKPSFGSNMSPSPLPSRNPHGWAGYEGTQAWPQRDTYSSQFCSLQQVPDARGASNFSLINFWIIIPISLVWRNKRGNSCTYWRAHYKVSTKCIIINFGSFSTVNFFKAFLSLPVTVKLFCFLEWLTFFIPPDESFC